MPSADTNMPRHEIYVTEPDRKMSGDERKMPNHEEKSIFFASTPDSVVALVSLEMCVIEEISKHFHQNVRKSINTKNSIITD
jgi:hypothetical protein